MTQEEAERIPAAHGTNYDRMVDVKNTYDPENLFRLNQNIRPTVSPLGNTAEEGSRTLLAGRLSLRSSSHLT
jgi:hypothetical protein